jgi:probable HAF family extracellular repeat protein
MKTEIVKKWFGWVMTAALLATMATPIRVAGQEASKGHHHYKLIDLGTLGGPASTVFGLTRPLNNAGVLASCADTSSLDPNYPSINPFFGTDTFIQHAFEWQNGDLDDLGTLRGGTSSCAQWITDRGLIVGGATNGSIDPLLGLPEIRAVLWHGRHILDLGTFGGNESIAFGANDHGQIAGGALNKIPDPYIGQSSLFNPFFITGGTQVHAFLWSSGVKRDLGTLGTGTDSMAFYVNNHGQAAGPSFTDAAPNPGTGIPTVHPFLWDDGEMKDLGTLGGTLVTLFGALNNRGQVAGSMTLAGDLQGSPDGFTRHPFFWDGRELKDLGTLGGSSADGFWLNDAGEVVGASFTGADQSYVAFIWRKGVMTKIGSLDGDTCSNAQGINSVSQVVGTSSCSVASSSRAYLWEHGGPLVDLQTLVVPGSNVSLTEAVYINDRGEIAANGLTPNGDNHAIFLIPCDDGHRNIKGCDFETVGPAATTGLNSAHLALAPAAAFSQSKMSASEMIQQIRSLRANRNRWFGNFPQK